MKLKKLTSVLILALSSLYFQSCTCWVRTIIPKEVKRNIRFCYNGEYSGLDAIIPINGFYKTVRNYTTWDNNLKKRVPRVDTVDMVFYPDGLFYKQYRWGNYKVFGDTIITIQFSPPCGMSWGAWESKYKINANNTVTYIAVRPLPGETKTIEKSNSKDGNEYQVKYSDAFFIQSDSLPSREGCWLFKTSWFKCK